MRLRFLLSTLLLPLCLAGCKPSSGNEANYSKKGGAVKSPSNPSIDGIKNPPGTTPGDESPSTPASRRQILAKIMEAVGGEQDQACREKKPASKRQLRLLTRNEYQQTVKDILQVTEDYRPSLPSETTVLGFGNNADSAQVSDSHASNYMSVAISIAGATKTKLSKLVACEESAGLTCAQKVVDTLAPKLWRRPLEAQEKTKLLDLYKIGLASSAPEGMTLLLGNLLTAPAFLYRSEIGSGTSLTPYERASALSYFFWGTSPDAALQSLAASGELAKEAVLLAQAERLWSDPKSQYLTREFPKGWLDSEAILHSEKDAKTFPGFTDEIKTAMASEVQASFDAYVRQPTATFESLFEADYTVGPAKLATYYKGQSVTEAGVSKIKFPNTPRKGVLGFGAILAHLATSTETHPIERGNFVLDRLFCSIPFPTPEALEVAIPPPSKGATTRERFADHTKQATCAACHIAIDGIGFGMEDFDGAGLYRDMDNGKKVDNAGEVVGIDGTTTKFKGVGELASYIADSSQAKRCFVVEWFRYANGHAERSEDICAIREMANKFDKGSMTIPQLLMNLITNPSYTQKD